MIKLGIEQELKIINKTDFGVYLSEGDDKEKVLLPIKQVPKSTAVGDTVKVFVYRDSKDRIIATTNEPKLTLGKVARLRVLEVGKIGAFLDWGLEKDLLLPFKEQTRKIKSGDEVLVALYVDKSERLCATMKIYHYLESSSPYKKDDRVKGEIYEISDNFGAFVAVDDKYLALISKKEMYGSLQVGDVVEARVAKVKEDGKLDLSLKERVEIQMSIDSAKLMDMIKLKGGYLDFNDKASPQLIRKRTDMSKNEFKRAVGNLLKAGLIEIKTDSIVLKNKMGEKNENNR